MTAITFVSQFVWREPESIKTNTILRSDIRTSQTLRWSTDRCDRSPTRFQHRPCRFLLPAPAVKPSYPIFDFGPRVRSRFFYWDGDVLAIWMISRLIGQARIIAPDEDHRSSQASCVVTSLRFFRTVFAGFDYRPTEASSVVA